MRKILMLGLACLAAACAAPGSGGGGGAGGQSAADARAVIDGLTPTTRFVANADATLMWQAASSYMERAFPLETDAAANDTGPRPAPAPPTPQNAGVVDRSLTAGGVRFIETKLIEWMDEGFLHRTRLMVRVVPEPSNPQHVRLSVNALLIEPDLDLAHAQNGQNMVRRWLVRGSNLQVEQAVLDQIMLRYMALLEHRDVSPDQELITPLSKLKPQATKS